MGVVDMVARGVAITVLLFVASFLILTFLSFYVSDLAPLRHSLLIALLASASAAVPIMVVHLTRSASGAPGAAVDRSATHFTIYAVLATALAVLFASLILSGQLRL